MATMIENNSSEAISPLAIEPAVAVIMTTHNNQAKCLESLLALEHAAKVSKLAVHVFLANSGTEFLGELILNKNVRLTELQTHSETFWAEGMRKAWEAAQASSIKWSYMLWLNDDTILFRDALTKLRSVIDESSRPAVAIGTCVGSDGEVTYGGKKRRGRITRLHFVGVLPSSRKSIECETFNGNIVFLKRSVDLAIGGFPKKYSHLRADLDYGLTALKKGVRPLIAPGVLGKCEHNPSYKTYANLKGLTLKEKIMILNSPKFGPYSEHVRFSFRHGGLFGIFYALAPVFRLLLSK